MGYSSQSGVCCHMYALLTVVHSFFFEVFPVVYVEQAGLFPFDIDLGA